MMEETDFILADDEVPAASADPESALIRMQADREGLEIAAMVTLFRNDPSPHGIHEILALLEDIDARKQRINRMIDAVRCAVTSAPLGSALTMLRMFEQDIWEDFTAGNRKAEWFHNYRLTAGSVIRPPLNGRATKKARRATAG